MAKFPTCKMKMKSLHFRMAYLNTCTMLFVQEGKESSPYWSINKPHRFPAPHGSVICRKAQKHIVFPLSCTQSWFSHQNIPFSSFQLIKGQLDISLLHQPQLWLVEMGHGKVLVPKTLSPETKDFKIHASKGEIYKEIKIIFEVCTYICLCLVFTIHKYIYIWEGWNLAWKNFTRDYLSIYLSIYLSKKRERDTGTLMCIL